MAVEHIQRCIADLESARQELRDAVEALGDAASLPAGDNWTIKEMLSHVAFWEEAPEGWVTLVARQQPLPPGWAFGSGYEAEADWPTFEVHNAREAAWGRSQAMRAVEERWARAHASLLDFLETITEAEAAEHAEYFSGLATHIREHLDTVREMNP